MYYVIEHQKRPDGVVNTTETARSSYALGQSYYYERLSKMIVNTAFVSVSIMFVDEDLNVFMNETVKTAYVPEVEAPQEETT